MEMSELKNELDGFIGTENYYRHFTGLKFTDGVKHLADKVGAYWLIDVVASYQHLDKVKALRIQFWKIEVSDKKAVVTCVEDSGMKPTVKQEIEYTDFPSGELTLYCQNNVLHLPSEY